MSVLCAFAGYSQGVNVHLNFLEHAATFVSSLHCTTAKDLDCVVASYSESFILRSEALSTLST